MEKFKIPKKTANEKRIRIFENIQTMKSITKKQLKVTEKALNEIEIDLIKLENLKHKIEKCQKKEIIKKAFSRENKRH